LVFMHGASLGPATYFPSAGRTSTSTVIFLSSGLQATEERVAPAPRVNPCSPARRRPRRKAETRLEDRPTVGASFRSAQHRDRRRQQLKADQVRFGLEPRSRRIGCAVRAIKEVLIDPDGNAAQGAAEALLRRGFAVTIESWLDGRSEQLEGLGTGGFVVVQEVRSLVRQSQALLVVRQTSINEDEAVAPLRDEASAERAIW
jgi:hypothetical protein